MRVGTLPVCGFRSGGRQCHQSGRVSVRVGVSGHAWSLSLPRCAEHVPATVEQFEREGFAAEADQ